MRKPRKPKPFNINLMSVYCAEDEGDKEVDVYINGTYTKLNDLKKFHATLGKAIEWAEYRKNKK
jgi:hypothetical protein